MGKFSGTQGPKQCLALNRPSKCQRKAWMNEYAWLGSTTTGLICQLSASDAVAVGKKNSGGRRPGLCVQVRPPTCYVMWGKPLPPSEPQFPFINGGGPSAGPAISKHLGFQLGVCMRTGVQDKGPSFREGPDSVPWRWAQGPQVGGLGARGWGSTLTHRCSPSRCCRCCMNPVGL